MLAQMRRLEDEEMLFIYQKKTDPYFNLAAEEYILEEKTGDAFLLWRNGPSVIIGKNQNAYAELHLPFVQENEICVARRLTGGGAVFHDLGNVNFTFITDAPEQGEIDFERFTAPMIKALKELGVQAALGGRNDILANGRKVSGNAQCVHHTRNGRKRLLHHGTLLFSADMSRLSGSLKVNREKMKAKGIQSVESRVANIRDLPEYIGPDTVEGFLEALISSAAALYGPAREYTPEETAAIQKIADNKFSTWEWIFGQSREYSVCREKRFDFGTVSVSLDADQGIIRQAAFSGDYFGVRDTADLAQRLVGCRLEAQDLSAALAGCEAYIYGSTNTELVNLILGR